MRRRSTWIVAESDPDFIVDPWELASFGPKTSGTGYSICLRIALNPKPSEVPRILVYQGSKPPENPISVPIPTRSVGKPRVLCGQVQLDERVLEKVFDFIMQNRKPLLRCWRDPKYGTHELLDELKPVS
jgi:hypothetical protein